MKRSVKLTLALIAISAAGLSAQEIRPRAIRPGAVGGVGAFGGAQVAPAPAPARMGGVERILRMKDELKLTAAQVSQLEAIRKEQVTKRQQEATARIELESRIAAGLATREETREQLAARRDKILDEAEATQDRIEKILTEEQRDRLREQRLQRARALVRSQGFGRGGMMGPGFAPRRQQFGPGRGFEQGMRFQGVPQGRIRFYFEPRGPEFRRDQEMRMLPRRRGEL